jgi:hypothetical protein
MGPLAALGRGLELWRAEQRAYPEIGAAAASRDHGVRPALTPYLATWGAVNASVLATLRRGEVGSVGCICARALRPTPWRAARARPRRRSGAQGSSLQAAAGVARCRQARDVTLCERRWQGRQRCFCCVPVARGKREQVILSASARGGVRQGGSCGEMQSGCGA